MNTNLIKYFVENKTLKGPHLIYSISIRKINNKIIRDNIYALLTTKLVAGTRPKSFNVRIISSSV